jgi:MYXO-CTERM domain-containing protein
VLAELPDDMWPETVEVAESDANRIYVSGTASADALQGIVERSDDGGLSWTRTTMQLPHGSGSLFLSGIHPEDPDRLWFRVPGRGDIYGVLPARLWLSKDGAASFEQVADTQGGMLGFAVSPDGDRVVFGGPLDGLFVAPSDASAAPSKLSELGVTCLRWRASGLYACALETTDPYSLGHAVEPTEGFVPLWHRADTCRAACTSPSPLEMNCREPWEMIAPLIDAGTALCDGSSSMPDAGTVVDASPDTPEPSETAPGPSASGCAVTFHPGVSTPWWLAAVLMLAGWRRRPRSSRS